MTTYVCPRCSRTFDRKSNYDQHLRRKNPCLVKEELHVQEKSRKAQEYICDMCGHSYSSVSNLNKHKRSRCKGQLHFEENTKTNTLNLNQKSESEIENVRKEFITLKNEFEKFKNDRKIVNNQNILQVLCIRSNDNYLDMLTDQCGDFHQALEFIKDCALSSISGDCKLLNKIYFNAKPMHEVPIKYVDKNQHVLEYFNDEREKIVDYKGQRLVKILANNLQNSYLKDINYLITKNLNNNMSPNKLLEDYDIQSWNAHIFELSDSHYQRKIVTQLEIPPSNDKR